MTMPVAFLGLGNMGGPMAQRVAGAGHAVLGFDPVPEARERARAAIGVADDPMTAVADAEVVITMLPTGAHVRQLYLVDGVIARLRPGTLLIDASTVDVATARALAEAAEARGHQALDAPVSGGVGGATAGTLTFMVGGAPEAVERARPLLAAMGQRVVHCGAAGAGQAAKICNNMILGVSMIAVSEAFNLADALGLDRQKLFEVASTSSGQCWSLTSYCPVPGPVAASPANRDYAPGFTAAMMLKDLLLARAEAEAGGVATPLGRAAADLYAAFAREAGTTDFSGIVRYLRDR